MKMLVALGYCSRPSFSHHLWTQAQANSLVSRLVLKIIYPIFLLSIINTVGNDGSRSFIGKIVIQDRERLGAVSLPFLEEFPNILLLFDIHTYNWITFVYIFFLMLLKLLIS